MGLWNKIKQKLFRSSNENQSRSMEEKMVRLVKMVALTEDEELSCDEVFHLLDQYAELALKGEDISKFMPQVRHHLNLCGECKEEYEALLEMMSASVV